MSGLINLLRQSIQTGNEDPQVYLSMMTQSIDKMETLLEQFEDFLENSKKDLTHEPVDIQSIISNILNEVQPVAEELALRITVNVEQSGYFYTDVHRFRLILFHLISNAIQFYDREKTARWIDIIVKATPANCNIQVNDNGIGMPYEIHARIFDLFFRGSEKSGGSGVGLHIVHEVLKKMGGSISVNSQMKEGSNFFVWLPNMIS
jgi:signal transduction histidine kinase